MIGKKAVWTRSSYCQLRGKLIDLRQIAHEQCQVKVEVTTSGLHDHVTFVTNFMFVVFIVGTLTERIVLVCQLFHVRMSFEDICCSAR
jgi:hypothetical protein